jgi:tetratricopeptide (TPR) repeat protein
LGALGTTLAETFFLDDLPGAAVTASRLNDILVRIHKGLPLSKFQQRFLEERALKALLELSCGALTIGEFRPRAEAEQRARLAASAVTKAQEDEHSHLRQWQEDDSSRLRQEATDRKNAILFARRERRRAQRKFFEDFGLGYIEEEHFSRVRRIVRQLSSRAELQKADLIWLAGEGREYWTDGIRRAHHSILAERFALEWRQSGDVWKAVTACSQWRKAKLASEALSVAGEALGRNRAPKVRSALLTTRGGALRDLGRHQEALKQGAEAHALCPDDYRPCTLLGAVHMVMSRMMV